MSIDVYPVPGADHGALCDQFPRLKPVFDLIEAELASDLSVGRMAAAVSMSPSHFRRYFKQMLGRSYVRYLHSYRVQRAAQLLGRSDLTLAQIAGEVGFCDQSYFGLVFRRQLGTTPAAFRRQRRRETTPPPASGTRTTSDVCAA